MSERTPKNLRSDIAQRVMAWESKPITWAYTGNADVWHDHNGTPRLPEQSWRPDEDDAQCMQVVDRMAAIGFEFSMNTKDGLTLASFQSASGAGNASDACRRIAILEAALQAVS